MILFTSEAHNLGGVEGTSRSVLILASGDPAQSLGPSFHQLMEAKRASPQPVRYAAVPVSLPRANACATMGSTVEPGKEHISC